MSRPPGRRFVRRVAFLAAAVLSLSLAGCLDGLAARSDGVPLHDALLRNDPYRLLILEVDAVAGLEPDPAALRAFQDALQDVTGKSVVAVVGPDTLPSQGGGYTSDELRQIHRSTADLAPTTPGVHGSGSTAFLHIVYLDGTVQDGDGHTDPAGRTLREEGAIFVFKELFRNAYLIDNGTLTALGADVERAVLLHEAGHALGLVGREVPMVRPHDDPDRPGHSANSQSVMHGLLPMSPSQSVKGPIPTGFDADDLADLAAYRARA